HDGGGDDLRRLDDAVDLDILVDAVHIGAARADAGGGNAEWTAKACVQPAGRRLARRVLSGHVFRSVAESRDEGVAIILTPGVGLPAKPLNRRRMFAEPRVRGRSLSDA